MSENIRGYRGLSNSEVDAINTVKRWEDKIGEVIDEFRTDPLIELDPKFEEVAVTTLQQGFMALTRAIAKPESRLK